MSKSDYELGERVREHLLSKGLETPLVTRCGPITDPINTIEHHFRSIMEVIGLDLNDDSLCDTPARLSKMFHQELFWGLDYAKFPKCTAIDNKMRYDEMIVEKGINVMSVCEHHFQTIHGKAAIAYIPGNKVIGLSKMNRIVQFFARRPQVQERLTMQVAEAMKFILETDDVAVHINARHYCVIARGIEDQNSTTSTSYVHGRFRDNASLKQEFLTAING